MGSETINRSVQEVNTARGVPKKVEDVKDKATMERRGKPQRSSKVISTSSTTVGHGETVRRNNRRANGQLLRITTTSAQTSTWVPKKQRGGQRDAETVGGRYEGGREWASGAGVFRQNRRITIVQLK